MTFLLRLFRRLFGPKVRVVKTLNAYEIEQINLRNRGML